MTCMKLRYWGIRIIGDDRVQRMGGGSGHQRNEDTSAYKTESLRMNLGTEVARRPVKQKSTMKCR